MSIGKAAGPSPVFRSMIAKYKIIFDEMVNKNKELFDQFKDIHDKYQEHPKQYQAQFNQVGEEIQKVIRKYENKLCGHTENSGFGKFSANLSTLFWEQIRALFPKIDDVGLL